MKLLTLNTHSLIEKNQAKKLETVAEAIKTEEFDVIALQEVNQPKLGKICDFPQIINLGCPIRKGNYMAELLDLVNDAAYKGVWCGFKESYGIFEEGVGIISRFPIESAKSICLSSGREALAWKRRYAVEIKTLKGSFISTHMGWWNDKDEPFSLQWKRLIANITAEKVWIMGDFNAESDARDEGYAQVIKDGFFDTYHLAKERDDGYTVTEKIDGWQTAKRKRIDYIFSGFSARVRESKVVFDGKNYDRVSDHFGVMIETES